VSAGPPITIQRDQHGNAPRRHSHAVGRRADRYLHGPAERRPILCLIFGTTTLFDAPTLAALYPTHKAFTSAYDKALKRAVKKGWILEPDAKLIKKWAAGSNIGG